MMRIRSESFTVDFSADPLFPDHFDITKSPYYIHLKSFLHEDLAALHPELEEEYVKAKDFELEEQLLAEAFLYLYEKDHTILDNKKEADSIDTHLLNEGFIYIVESLTDPDDVPFFE